MNDSILIIVGGLALALIVVIVVLNARRKPTPPPITPIRTQPSEDVLATSVNAPTPPVRMTLEFLLENGPSVTCPLDKPLLTVGRAEDNDIIVPAAAPQQDTVSLHHAQLRRDQDDYVLRDLESRNGLTVNGHHTRHNLLQDGDRISFGEVEAIYHRPTGGAA